jgi:dTDP-4-dehydrorhamnose reductase
MDVVYHLASAHLELSLRPSDYWQINVGATTGLLEAAHAARVRRVVHCSSVGVMGDVKNPPGDELSPLHPTNHYEQTKLAGEQAVQAAGIPYLIFRTSWVYGMRGKNFLLTVLRLAQERNELRIVADQHGAPTWCRTLADTTAHVVAQARVAVNAEHWWQQHAGLYHVTAQGQTTWHGFTEAILQHASLDKKPAVIPIATRDYPTPARRPVNSVLSCERLINTFCTLPAWDDALALCMEK